MDLIEHLLLYYTHKNDCGEARELLLTFIRMLLKSISQFDPTWSKFLDKSMNISWIFKEMPNNLISKNL